MTFEQFWTEVEKQKILPNIAIYQLPMSLLSEMKTKLMEYNPKAACEILVDVIEQINHGSVESVERLLRKLIGCKHGSRT